MSSGKDTQQAVPDMCKGPSGFLMIFLGLFTFMVMFNWDIRMKLAGWIGYVLFPLIGFDFDGNGAGDIPIITLLLAGIILATFSTVIRHFQTDWVEMARNQKQMKAVNKALREAKLGGDTEKEKRITEHQQKMMGLQQNMMFNNLKMMVYTMLVAIAIFTWIWADFMEDLDVAMISVPWNLSMNAMDRINVCFGQAVPMYKWLLIYILLSFPLGLMVQHALKLYTFKKKIVESEGRGRAEMEGILHALEEAARDLEEDVTFPLDTVTDKIARARELFVSGDNPGARECALLARAEMEATERAFGKCKKRIEDAERNIDKAGREGMDVSRMKNSVEAARQAMEEGSFKEAISKAQEANEQLKKDKKVYRTAMEDAKDVKSLLYDVRKISPDKLDQDFEGMEKRIKKGKYKEAIRISREIKREVKKLKEENQKYRKLRKKFSRLLEDASGLGMDVTSGRAAFEESSSLYEGRELKKAGSIISSLYAELRKEMADKRDVADALSHTKLIISNAREAGASVSSPEARYKAAEDALARGETGKAMELLTVASREAERLKSQISRKSRRK